MPRLFWAVVALTLATLTGSTRAGTLEGYVVVHSRNDIRGLEARVAEAVGAQGMNLVNRASASDGAKGRGITIRGDVVLGVFRNDFAVRMLAADVDAGIEAPIRFHLVEEADGTSSLRFRKPSAVFGGYGNADLLRLGLELDPVFEAIAQAATTP